MAAAFSNRALARLKLGRAAEAEIDCDHALLLQPTNVKALLRRAAARYAHAYLFGVLAFSVLPRHDPLATQLLLRLTRMPAWSTKMARPVVLSHKKVLKTMAKF